MMTGHFSAGPWTTEMGDVVDAQGRELADCYSGPPDIEFDEADANAHLMAAAPDLVLALHALGVHPEYGYCFCRTQEQQQAGHTGECRQARAALLKAGVMEEQS